jgi:hypothetical protein
MSTAAGIGPRHKAGGNRIAAGPISWGVCEGPSWGVELPAVQVLPEILQEVGVVTTTEGRANRPNA